VFVSGFQEIEIEKQEIKENKKSPNSQVHYHRCFGLVDRVKLVRFRCIVVVFCCCFDFFLLLFDHP